MGEISLHERVARLEAQVNELELRISALDEKMDKLNSRFLTYISTATFIIVLTEIVIKLI